MQMLGWLIACLLLVCAGLIFFYRGNAGWRPGARGPRKLQVEETRGLGQRQFLAVVEYEGRRMLLGVCPGRIDYLCPLDGPGESAQDFQAWVPEESRKSVPGMSPESAGEAGMQAGTKMGQAGKGAA
jgi:flagellar protein FliO/FliZ